MDKIRQIFETMPPGLAERLTRIGELIRLLNQQYSELVDELKKSMSLFREAKLKPLTVRRKATPPQIKLRPPQGSPLVPIAVYAANMSIARPLSASGIGQMSDLMEYNPRHVSSSPFLSNISSLLEHEPELQGNEIALSQGGPAIGDYNDYQPLEMLEAPAGQAEEHFSMMIESDAFEVQASRKKPARRPPQPKEFKFILDKMQTQQTQPFVQPRASLQLVSIGTAMLCDNPEIMRQIEMADQEHVMTISQLSPRAGENIVYDDAPVSAWLSQNTQQALLPTNLRFHRGNVQTVKDFIDALAAYQTRLCELEQKSAAEIHVVLPEM